MRLHSTSARSRVEPAMGAAHACSKAPYPSWTCGLSSLPRSVRSRVRLRGAGFRMTIPGMRSTSTVSRRKCASPSFACAGRDRTGALLCRLSRSRPDHQAALRAIRVRGHASLSGCERMPSPGIRAVGIALPPCEKLPRPLQRLRAEARRTRRPDYLRRGVNGLHAVLLRRAASCRRCRSAHIRRRQGRA